MHLEPFVCPNVVPRRARRARLSLPALASLLVACGAPAASRAQPPASSSAAATASPAQREARAQLMSRLSALSADSMEGRRAGTAGSQRARRWIVAQLTAMGAPPVTPAGYTMPVRLPARAGADTLGANVVARIPGRSPNGRTLVVSAHYDHLGVRNGEVFNGADDDASGCVALLAIAERLLKSPPTHDVLLVFFDAEETGMQGSTQFVAAPPVPVSQIAVNLNLDMVSRQDANALWVAGTSHSPFLKTVAESAVRQSVVPIRFGHDTRDLKPGDDWTASSDHRAFHAKGIPFLYVGVEDHADYHRPGDDAAKVDPAFFAAVVDFAYALLRAVDGAAHTFPAR